jgi:TonB family protein
MPAVLEQPSRRDGILPVEPPRAQASVSTAAVFTFVLWSGCLVIGVLGIVLPYTRPSLSPAEQPAIKAEMLQVELTSDPLPPIIPQTVTPPQPPVLDQLPTAPEIPPMTRVAEANAVAFALPVKGPVTIVEPEKASFAAAPVAEPKSAVTAPPVQVLTYGHGEGRQPAPEYPLRARREGQEGVVGIRFSVGEDGRVLSAEAVSPSPWKLLNDSALRVVRERWRFSPGPPRLYEVSIRFQLTN